VTDDVKVTELPVKAAPADADLFMLVDQAGGIVSSGSTKAQLLALFYWRSCRPRWI